ncbi:hypothetical protein D3C85_1763330 [compost metagenome]
MRLGGIKVVDGLRLSYQSLQGSQAAVDVLQRDCLQFCTVTEALRECYQAGLYRLAAAREPIEKTCSIIIVERGYARHVRL